MLSRRALLLAAGAGVVGSVALRFELARPESVVADLLRRQLDYLRLDPAGVEAFARDLVARGDIAPTKLRLLSATGMARLATASEVAGSHALHQGAERIVTYYLLSSDFFVNGADEARTVHYLGFYDAFRRACLNPFAHAVADEIR